MFLDEWGAVRQGTLCISRSGAFGLRCAAVTPGALLRRRPPQPVGRGAKRNH